MKPTLLISCMVFCFSNFTNAQLDVKQDNYNSTTTITTSTSPKNRINFYVVNKPKTLDLFSRMVIWRARLRGMSRRDKFKVIVARSSKEACEKMMEYLQNRDGVIGSLWFDTHGHYANGYSSFTLGEDQFSYKTINDSSYTKYLRMLSAYCDANTKVAIGSCYSGAIYEKPAHNGIPASRMNGDSLVIGLANILPTAAVYGTGGWVMTKPGIFARHRYALAGYPLQRRFKDKVYKPVWENMGVWYCYNTCSKIYVSVNTLSLTRMGTIHVKSVSYLEKEEAKKKLNRNLEKLRDGIIKS